MNAPMQDFMEAQRALMETQRHIGSTLFEGATKVFQLNMLTAARTMSASATRPAPTAGSFTPDAASLQAASRSGMDAAAGYARQLFEAVSTTNSQMVRLMQQQANDWQRLVSAMGSGSAGMDPRLMGGATSEPAAGSAQAPQ